MPNPILAVHAADPHLCLFGGRYYLYATDAGVHTSLEAFSGTKPESVDAGFAAWSSADLIEWKNEGQILRLKDVGWCSGRDWAPAVIARNGKYYFYFSADDRIGIAVGDSPLGPFADPLGQPLCPYRDDISVIDPCAFTDDDGRSYLFWGAVPAHWLDATKIDIRQSLSVRELNPDMISFRGPELETISVCHIAGTPWSDVYHIEAQFIVKRSGIYYLMWSAGNYGVTADAEAYRVFYATAPSPLGPWTVHDDPPLLSSDHALGRFGPGHHAVLQVSGDDKWICAYHAHDGRHKNPAPPNRRVYLDRLTFAGDTMEPVRLTEIGVGSRPVDLWLELVRFEPFRAGETIELRLHAADKSPADFAEVALYANGKVIGYFNTGTTFTWSPPPGFYRMHASSRRMTGEWVATAPIDLDVLP